MRGFRILFGDGRPVRGVDIDATDHWFRDRIARPFAPDEARLSRIEMTVVTAFRTERPARHPERRPRPRPGRPHLGARICLAVAAPAFLAVVFLTQAGVGPIGQAGPSQPGLHDAVDRTRLPTARPTAPLRVRDRETGGGVGVSSGHVPAPHDAGRSGHCRPGPAAQRTPIGDPPR